MSIQTICSRGRALALCAVLAAAGACQPESESDLNAVQRAAGLDAFRAGRLSNTPDWTAEPDLEDEGFAYSVASAGDVNGDGYDDVVVGHHNDTSGHDRVSLYFGSATGLSSAPSWQLDHGWTYGDLGYAVASAGDVNNDGFSDVILGEPTFGSAGRALVFYGSAAGLSASADWTIEPPDVSGSLNAEFGGAVASAGDVNGDGFDDVIVGAKYWSYPTSGVGRAFVYHGSASGLSAVADWSAGVDVSQSFFGWSVASAGDLNGDGFDDVVVGAPGYGTGSLHGGGVFVYFGSAQGLAASANWVVETDEHMANLGKSVASAGDVNGDGFADVLIGCPDCDVGGGALVFHGSAQGLGTAVDWFTLITDLSDQYGGSVASAGDVNGDGFDDVVVGSPWADNPEFNEGAA